MKMSKLAVAVLAASAAMMSQALIAAPVATQVKLTQVQGDVMVNNGSRFVKAVSGLQLKPGAKIVTAKSSNVALVYQNGCVKQVNQNSMLTVGTPEQCAADAGKERIYVAKAVGDTQTDAPGDMVPNAKKFPGVGYGIGSILALGTVVAVTSNDNGSNNNNNASPQ